MEAKIFTLLSADANVEALVNTRIFPVVMPQGSVLPAITYHETANSPVNTLAGKTGLENPTFAINSWATSHKTANTLSKAVSSAMDGVRTFRALLINEIDVYDPEIDVFAKAQTYSCWNQN